MQTDLLYNNNKTRKMKKNALLSHFPDMKYVPRWGVLLMDIFLCTIAFIISVLIGSSLFHYGWEGMDLNFFWQLVIILFVQILSFCVFQTYSGIIRYSTFVDIIKVFLSLILSTSVLLAVGLTSRYGFGINILMSTATLIYFPVAFVLLFCLRVGVKTIYDSAMLNVGGQQKVFIYGTREAGLAIAKMLRSSGSRSMYSPVGFIQDKNDEKAYSIQGLKVYPLNDYLFEVMKAKDVNSVIVSPLKMKAINPATDLDIFLQHNIHILTSQTFSEWDHETGEKKPQIGRIDSIQIEDLLERPTININTENVSTILKKKVVMVTGAAGSIGSEIVRQVINFNPSLVLLVEQGESPLHDLRLDLQDQYPDLKMVPIIADVRNREHMEQIFREYKPRVVFHAAAYKHVPLMEEYPNEAILANVLGTKNVADLSVKYKVQRFVMISTDKAVNPTNVMGASKRIAEIYVQSLFKKLNAAGDATTRFITTRFGNVLGSNGSVIPYFKKQIAAGGPVTVTHPKIIRFFMTIPEACTLVLEAATLGNGGEIFVFDMGQPVKILDLAKKMIRLAGYRPGIDIPITFTGLRPGEKLYEEVLNDEELTLPTVNEKIKIAKVREVDYDEVSELIEKLIECSKTETPMRTVSIMKEIVPEFISKNSIYEQLDKKH